MSMYRTAAVAFLAFTTFPQRATSASNLPPSPQAAEVPERVAADTPRVTPGGATFMVPSGWSIVTGKNLVILEPPETDTHIAIVDSQAADASAAVAAGWAAYKPEAKRPLKLVTPRPARQGWDERQAFEYETSPNERAVVEALALRAGSKWTAVILDGSEPTVEKRSAPIGLIFESLRPKGYQRESFAGRKPQPLDAAHIAQIKAFVETSMQELGIPGASMALIDGGKVVYEGGIGVRELGKPERVDENTLFMAASNTKGMTTLLLSELVDERKLKWDQPVIEVYPSFKLGDAETTKKVLVKNLICACTGLPRQDLEWIFEFKNATPDSTLALLGTMQPTSKFGEVFQYSNLMAAAAGYIGTHLVYPNRELGAAYDEAMQQKIFRSAGDEVDDIRLCACSRRQPCEPARGRCGWQAHRGQHGVQLLDRAGPSRGRRVDVGRRSDPLPATRAGAGEAAQRQAAGFGRKFAGAPCAPDFPWRRRDLWNGLGGRPHLRRSRCESRRQHGGLQE